MSPPQLRFDGRVAVITGAGSGIGEAHARLLAGRGAAVVVNDIDIDAAESVVADLRASGAAASACGASVGDEEGAEAIVRCATSDFGRLDVLINNAGLLRSSPVADFATTDWDDILTVSLKGPFMVTRAAWPVMAAAGFGRVVMTTSNSGLLGIPGSAAYASAKAGLWGLTRVLSIEGEASGINVNAIAPMAYTAMSARSAVAPRAWRDGTGDEWSRRLDPASVAAVAAWLCHESCAVTGEVISAAGGRVARYFMGLTEGFASDHLDAEEVRDRFDEALDTVSHKVYRRAFEEGRDLHRRLLG